MPLKLYVKTLAGNIYTIDVTPTQSIKLVKRLLMNKILHDPNRPERFNSSATLRLSYFSNESVELSDFKTIGDYPFLKNNSELALIIEIEELYADINVQVNGNESLKLITTPYYKSMSVSEFKQSIASQLREEDVIKKITTIANGIDKQTKTLIPPTPKHMASYMKVKQSLYDVINVLNNDFELYIGRCSSKNSLMEDDTKLSDYPEMEEGVDLCIVFDGHHINSNRNSNNSNRTNNNSNSNTNNSNRTNSNSNSNYNSNYNGGKRRKTRRTKRTVHRKTKRSGKK